MIYQRFKPVPSDGLRLGLQALLGDRVMGGDLWGSACAVAALLLVLLGAWLLREIGRRR